MKSFAVFALFVAGVSANVLRLDQSYASYAEPVLVRSQIPITSFVNDIRGSQSNHVQFSTGNGITVSDNTDAIEGRGSTYEDELGRMVQADSTLVKTGSFSYTSPEGLPITLTYRADESGFHAEGAHLPKPVEMPAELAQAYAEALARLPASSSSYEAPEILVKSSSYESAPVIRVQSYDAPAQVVIRSSY